MSHEFLQSYTSTGVTSKGILVGGESQVGKTQLLKTLSNSFTSPGIPSIYAGTQKAYVKSLMLFNNGRKEVVSNLFKFIDSCGFFEYNREQNSRNIDKLVEDLLNCLKNDIRSIHVIFITMNITKNFTSLENLKTILLFLYLFNNAKEGCKKALLLTFCDKISNEKELREKIIQIRTNIVLREIVNIPTILKYLPISESEPLSEEEEKEIRKQIQKVKEKTQKDIKPSPPCDLSKEKIKDILGCHTIDELVVHAKLLNAKLDILGIGSVFRESFEKEIDYEREILKNEILKNTLVNYIIDAEKSSNLHDFPIVIKEAEKVIKNMTEATELIQNLKEPQHLNDDVQNNLKEYLLKLNANRMILMLDICKEAKKQFTKATQNFKTIFGEETYKDYFKLYLH